MLKDYNANINFVERKIIRVIEKAGNGIWELVFKCLIVVHKYFYYTQRNTKNWWGKKLNNKIFRREVYSGLQSAKIIGVRSQIPNKKSSLNNEISNHKPFVLKRIRLQEAKHQPVGELVVDAQCPTKKTTVRTIWMCHTCQVLLCA